MKLFHLLCIASSVLCVSCSSAPEKDPYQDMSAQQIYHEAATSLQKNDYQHAVKAYEGLESHYPYGRYTEKGQLEIIYAYYKKDDPASALAAADHFIKLHPLSPQIDYVYYLKGVVKLNENKGLVDKLVTLDPATHDPSNIKEAIAIFSDLIKRYPNSRYAPLARQKIIYARNVLAQFEVNAADFYFRKQAYIASINRANYVVQELPQTTAIPEALQLMAKSYEALGMKDKARQAQEMLGRL